MLNISCDKGHQFNIIDNIDFLLLSTKSKSNGCEFIDFSDNIYLDQVILSRYTLNIKNLSYLMLKRIKIILKKI